MAEFHVEHADWSLDHEALQALRETVFVREQSVAAEEEWDGLDAQCEHVLAIADDGTPIGCGRLTPQRMIGRMAVLAEWRGRGVGKALLGALMERARERGWDTVSIHAQTRAIGFYQQQGFEAEGERFMEAGIEHQLMRRRLELLDAPPDERGKPPARPAAVDLKAESGVELKQAAMILLSQARRQIMLHGHRLQPMLPDEDEVIAQLRRIATAGRNASLRLLIHDADALLRDGHRLIHLAQRLESSIKVRVITEREDRDYPSSFLLNDQGGYLFQAVVEAPRAAGSTCIPGRQASLRAYFEEVWARSLPATVLRKLDL